jgi:hypothetical protein
MSKEIELIYLFDKNLLDLKHKLEYFFVCQTVINLKFCFKCFLSPITKLAFRISFVKTNFNPFLIKLLSVNYLIMNKDKLSNFFDFNFKNFSSLA